MLGMEWGMYIFSGGGQSMNDDVVGELQKFWKWASFTIASHVVFKGGEVSTRHCLHMSSAEEQT